MDNDEILVSEIKETVVLPEKNSKLTTPVAIIVGSALIALAIFFSNANISFNGLSGGNSDGGAKTAVNIKNVDLKDDPFVGEAKAPVAIAYWSDYQCPFCKKFETETMQQLKKNYVDTGKAKIVFKDYQFLGPDSLSAALYARAVWELYPEQFYAWREAVFAKQDAENGGWGSEANVKALTGTIAGIDAEKVASAVTANKEKYQKMIDDDKAEADKFGISGTPGFIVGKELIYGAQPLEAFTKVIDPLVK